MQVEPTQILLRLETKISMYCQVFNFNSRVGSLNIRERILKLKLKRYIYIKEVACDFVRFVSLKISLIRFRINEMTLGDFPQNIF